VAPVNVPPGRPREPPRLRPQTPRRAHTAAPVPEARRRRRLNSEPVEKPASSEATNSTRCVISSGSATRGNRQNALPPPLRPPPAVRPGRHRRADGAGVDGVDADCFVAPRAPAPPVLVSPRAPHFAGHVRGVCWGRAHHPARGGDIDDRAAAGSAPSRAPTARIPRYVPVRLMSITWRQAAGSVSAIAPEAHDAPRC